MKKVLFEEMLPHEMAGAVAVFPVAYCAFGSLEWHGKHLALGNDTLKAHHLLCLTAEKYGGGETIAHGIVDFIGKKAQELLAEVGK